MDGASTSDIVSRIRMEYIEMPDLKLTYAQARRLWSLSHEACHAALDTLVEAGFLCQTRDGSFLRTDHRIGPALAQTGANRVW